MKYVYFDNSSTSFPKAPHVGEAMSQYISSNALNVNRGSYGPAYAIEEIIYNTREAICELFHGPSPKHVIFTNNVTTSLNMVIKGLFSPSTHLLTSSMEHNAVMRPLYQLAAKGLTYTKLPCDTTGLLDLSSISRAVQPHTKALIINHASNVCGTVQDLARIGQICHDLDMYFIVDAAQSAGVIPINMASMHIDGLCFTGHKGLLGPQGIGGLILTDKLARILDPLISGGTGSFSHLESLPPILPDRFESGTPNIPGIIGLHESLKSLKSLTVEHIHTHESLLKDLFIELIQDIPTISIIGNPSKPASTITSHSNTLSTGVVSIYSDTIDLADLAYRLEKDYQILTRVGLHCAPSAHMTLGTYPTGTIRFSFGPYNTTEEVKLAAKALHKLTNELADK